jgi:hypothetical protein
MSDKERKAQGELKSWFDLYSELKIMLESRIFRLEERVKELERKSGRSEPPDGNNDSEWI